jgi:hypothetical protein
MNLCVLCAAEGEEKPADVPAGWSYPICAEHRAQSYWRSRQPAAPRAINLAVPPTSVDEALACGIDVRPLAGRVRHENGAA